MLSERGGCECGRGETCEECRTFSGLNKLRGKLRRLSEYLRGKPMWEPTLEDYGRSVHVPWRTPSPPTEAGCDRPLILRDETRFTAETLCTTPGCNHVFKPVRVLYGDKAFSRCPNCGNFINRQFVDAQATAIGMFGRCMDCANWLPIEKPRNEASRGDCSMFHARTSYDCGCNDEFEPVTPPPTKAGSIARCESGLPVRSLSYQPSDLALSDET
jgi:hypothetical protein